MILLPDDTGAVHAQWIAVGEGTHHECLGDDKILPQLPIQSE